MLFSTPIAHKVRSYKKAGAPAATLLRIPNPGTGCCWGKPPHSRSTAGSCRSARPCAMLFATPIAHKVRSYTKAGVPAAIAFANP